MLTRHKNQHGCKDSSLPPDVKPMLHDWRCSRCKRLFGPGLARLTFGGVYNETLGRMLRRVEGIVCLGGCPFQPEPPNWSSEPCPLPV